MAVSVEEVSSSLVREYLNRKGLKLTIACMDEEHPRTEASINNRSLLRQILSLEGLYRKNKVESFPLKTLLEIIVKYHINGHKNDKMTSNESDPMQYAQSICLIDNSTTVTPAGMTDSKSYRKDIYPSSLPETDVLSSPSPTGFQDYESGDKQIQPLLSSPKDNESTMKREAEKRTSTAESTQRSRNNRIRRGMMAGPVASTSQELNNKRKNRGQEVPKLILRKEENDQLRNRPVGTGLYQKSLKGGLSENSPADFVVGQQEFQSMPESLQREHSFDKLGEVIPKTRRVKSLPSTTVADLDMPEMVLDDIDDDDNIRELSKVSFGRAITEHSSTRSCPMDQHTAMGGPCGVLASVQAFVLKKLLFENIKRSEADLQRLRPSNTTRRKCLVSAVAEILWRAGEEKQAKIAINSGRNHFTPAGHYKSEGVLEKIACFTVDNFKDLQLLLEQHIDQFETGQLGCLLLTFSAVLTRSIEKVRGDMDVPTTTLIGAHGYCTQELVNLLLCGRAVSNVFDNDMELDSGNGNMTLLKGIKDHCDVGLLSLFEHYNILKVGAYLKTPLYPIWVVCSESHFSVLFGLQRELLTYQDKGLEFDLYYYDGLANQHEEIRLTVSVGNWVPSSQTDDTDLIPPMELCIRTRWKDAFVNWNDTEPIL
ncbi:putative ubiquitin carboxyl-terminal hydrolase MINDY-4 isoform 2-T2 [Tautogolabrus adspersus]